MKSSFLKVSEVRLLETTTTTDIGEPISAETSCPIQLEASRIFGKSKEGCNRFLC